MEREVINPTSLPSISQVIRLVRWSTVVSCSDVSKLGSVVIDSQEESLYHSSGGGDCSPFVTYFLPDSMNSSNFLQLTNGKSSGVQTYM